MTSQTEWQLLTLTVTFPTSLYIEDQKVLSIPFCRALPKSPLKHTPLVTYRWGKGSILVPQKRRIRQRAQLPPGIHHSHLIILLGKSYSDFMAINRLLTCSVAYGQTSNPEKICKTLIQKMSSIYKNQTFLILAGGTGYTSVRICQNWFNGILKSVHFTLCKLHLIFQNSQSRLALVHVVITGHSKFQEPSKMVPKTKTVTKSIL